MAGFSINTQYKFIFLEGDPFWDFEKIVERLEQYIAKPNQMNSEEIQDFIDTTAEKLVINLPNPIKVNHKLINQINEEREKTYLELGMAGLTIVMVLKMRGGLRAVC